MTFLPPLLRGWDSRCGSTYLDAEATQVAWALGPNAQAVLSRYLSGEEMTPAFGPIGGVSMVQTKTQAPAPLLGSCKIPSLCHLLVLK